LGFDEQQRNAKEACFDPGNFSLVAVFWKQEHEDARGASKIDFNWQ